MHLLRAIHTCFHCSFARQYGQNAPEAIMPPRRLRMSAVEINRTMLLLIRIGPYELYTISLNCGDPLISGFISSYHILTTHCVNLP